MCDKGVDDCLAALKFVPGWFVIDKIIRKLHETLLVDENFGNVTFFANKTMSVLSVDLNKTNLDDVDFYEDNPETIIHIRIFVWGNKFE